MKDSLLYPEVLPLIEELIANIRATLAGKLEALYLHGSLVYGDYDPHSSDIDLLAALSDDVSDSELAQLRQMHADFVIRHPEWDDRVEVCYISTAALRTIKTWQGQAVNISPGEPIHRVEIDKDWLMHWYLPRERSITLAGPPPESVIEPISKAEFVACVKDHVQNWDRWVQEMPRNQYALAYVILTLCRALYSVKNGEQVSKQQAARWAQKEIPAWAGFIQKGLRWKEAGRDAEGDEVAYQETVEFVDSVQKLIVEI